MVLLKACLNGGRTRKEHRAIPITPEELARDARNVVEAGAGALHVHPRSEHGGETLDAREVAAVVTLLHDIVTVPVGVSTGAWFMPAVKDRLTAIELWDALPDFASVNFHEEGAAQVAALLLQRGVDVEAGVWNPGAAEALANSGLADRCLRILIEPMESEMAAAMENVAEIERRLIGVADDVPRLLHGVDSTAWPMLDIAIARGYQGRMGFEDTLWHRTGGLAEGNGGLVKSAADIIRRTVADRRPSP